MRRQKRAIAAQREVSIHASVKDATTALFGTIERVGVSIHASVKDATQRLYNVRARENVSIHASVKDATYSPHAR